MLRLRPILAARRVPVRLMPRSLPQGKETFAHLCQGGIVNPIRSQSLINPQLDGPHAAVRRNWDGGFDAIFAGLWRVGVGLVHTSGSAHQVGSVCRSSLRDCLPPSCHRWRTPGCVCLRGPCHWRSLRRDPQRDDRRRVDELLRPGRAGAHAFGWALRVSVRSSLSSDAVQQNDTPMAKRLALRPSMRYSKLTSQKA